MKGLCQTYTQPGWQRQYRYEEVEEFEPFLDENDDAFEGAGSSEEETQGARQYREPLPTIDGGLPSIGEEPEGTRARRGRAGSRSVAKENMGPGDEGEDASAGPKGRLVRRTKKVNVNVPPVAEHHSRDDPATCECSSCVLARQQLFKDSDEKPMHLKAEARGGPSRNYIFQKELKRKMERTLEVRVDTQHTQRQSRAQHPEPVVGSGLEQVQRSEIACEGPEYGLFGAYSRVGPGASFFKAIAWGAVGKHITPKGMPRR